MSFLMVCLLFIAFGLVLGFASVKFRVKGDPIADRIKPILPQTQCGQCSFPGCRPYAEAIASGNADINQCPPGGQDGVDALADLLGLESKPLNAEFGIEKPKRVAVIIEQDCIGCTKCIQACPVDAIVGAAKQMHTVVANECTGCELCIAPCPVDCIVMEPVPEDLASWQWPTPESQIKGTAKPGLNLQHA